MTLLSPETMGLTVVGRKRGAGPTWTVVTCLKAGQPSPHQHRPSTAPARESTLWVSFHSALTIKVHGRPWREMNRDLAPAGLDTPPPTHTKKHAPGKFKVGSRRCRLDPERPRGTSSRLQRDPGRAEDRYGPQAPLPSDSLSTELSAAPLCLQGAGAIRATLHLPAGPAAALTPAGPALPRLPQEPSRRASEPWLTCL